MDLKGFPFWFPTGDVFAFAEAESVFLTGPAFERFRDAVEVRDAAQQVLDDFFAIGSLLWPPLRAPRIGTTIFARTPTADDERTQSSRPKVGRSEQRGVDSALELMSVKDRRRRRHCLARPARLVRIFRRR